MYEVRLCMFKVIFSLPSLCLGISSFAMITINWYE